MLLEMKNVVKQFGGLTAVSNTLLNPGITGA